MKSFFKLFRFARSNANGAIEKGGVWEMLTLALPMVFSMSFDTFLVFVNRLFLSRLGPEYMNAALTGGIMEMVTVTFFNGFIGYSAAMVAQNMGAQKQSRCSLVTVQALFIAVCSYPIVICLMPLAHIFLNYWTVDAKQGILQIQYYDVLTYGAIITMFRHSFACFFIGLGRTKIVMASTLTGLAVTLFFSYSFVFGKFGLPELNIYGAPISILMGSFSALCVLMFEFFSKKYKDRFRTNRVWRLSPRILKTLMQKGFPSGSEMFLNMLAFQCTILVFNAQGIAAATATSITFNWDLVSFVPLIGFEIGATSLVGRYVGARDFASANRSVFSGIKIGVFYSAAIFFLFVCFPEALTDIFAPDDIGEVWTESRPVAIRMLQLAAIYVSVETFMVVYAGALRGAGDTFAVMCIMSGLHWTMPIMGYLAFNVFGATVIEAWAIMVFIFTLFPVFLYLRWRSGKWRVKWEALR